MTNNQPNFVQGTCMEMCPPDEIKMREKEKLLHPLEMSPGTENYKTPLADVNRTVKSFGRSAAGKENVQSKNLRPPKVLLQTVSYLLFDVLNNNDLPFHKTYDFICDRLMAVRQDLVIQDVSKAESVSILQPIVRFHAYSAYRLSKEPLSNFDPVLNRNHLQECLKKLLTMYDAYDLLFDCLISSRGEFEAMYVLLNLGNEEALRRCLNLPLVYRNETSVRLAFEISNSYRHGNFARCCRVIRQLPALLTCVIALHIKEVRRRAIQIMSIAYHSQNLTFSSDDLRRILLYHCTDSLAHDCRHYGLDIIPPCIYFNRQKFRTDVQQVASRDERFIEDKLLAAENVQSFILT